MFPVLRADTYSEVSENSKKNIFPEISRHSSKKEIGRLREQTNEHKNEVKVLFQELVPQTINTASQNSLETTPKPFFSPKIPFYIFRKYFLQKTTPKKVNSH